MAKKIQQKKKQQKVAPAQDKKNKEQQIQKDGVKKVKQRHAKNDRVYHLLKLLASKT